MSGQEEAYFTPKRSIRCDLLQMLKVQLLNNFTGDLELSIVFIAEVSEADKASVAAHEIMVLIT